MKKVTVERKFSINGKVVEKSTTVGNTTVYYRSVESGTSVKYYFVQNDEVINTLKVDADMSQGTGYICSWKFE